MRRLSALFLALLLCLPADAYVRDAAPIWTDGNVNLLMKLGTGAADSSNTGLQALQLWNPYMQRVQLKGSVGSEGQGAKSNAVNEVFYSDKAYDKSFDANTLALTITLYSGGTRLESDVIVNNKYSWSNYSGYLQNSPVDLKRILAHEFGHVLGLSHPDENNQYVTALMNSRASYVEIPQEDDQDGVASMYGAGEGLAPVIHYTSAKIETYEGSGVELSVDATGGKPLTYEWYKEGTLIPGANSSRLIFAEVKLTDAGNFTVKVSNSVGAATSSPMRLTVLKETLPSFDPFSPHDTNALVGRSVTFEARVQSRTTCTLQWHKDGMPIVGATALHLTLPNLTLPDAGLYTVVATNKAGSVTSRAARLTVELATPPVIRRQPSPSDVEEGLYSYLDFSVSGTEPMSIVWYMDGSALPSPLNDSSLRFDPSNRRDDGLYHAKITNEAGSVTTNTVRLTILPATIPQISLQDDVQVMVGQSLRLQSYTKPNPILGNIRYQWFKDGNAILGATQAIYEKPSCSKDDEGAYVLLMSSDRASITSTAASVHIISDTTPVPGAWVASTRSGSIAAFIYANPARLETYDLDAGVWRTPLQLADAPTAICEGNGLFYIACGTQLYSTAVSTPSLVPIARPLPLRAEGLCMVNNKLVVYLRNAATTWNYNSIAVVDPLSGAVLGIREYDHRTSPVMVAAQALDQVFTVDKGTSPPEVVKFQIAPDNRPGLLQDAAQHGNIRSGELLWISPNQQLLYNNTGAVYDTTYLKLKASIGAYSSLDFDETGLPVLLEGRSLRLINTEMLVEKTISLSKPAETLYLNKGRAFAFSYPSTGQQSQVESVSLAAATNLPVSKPISPEGLAFTPDQIELDSHGNLLLLSRLHRHVFRWNTRTRRVACTHVQLHGYPSSTLFSQGLDSLFLLYRNTTIRRINLSDTEPSESGFAQAILAFSGLGDAGKHLLVSDHSGQGIAYSMLDTSGRLIRSTDVWAGGYPNYVWVPSKQRLYAYSTQIVTWVSLDASGQFGTESGTAFTSYSKPINKLYLSPDETNFLTDAGVFLDVISGKETNRLTVTPKDVCWIGQSPVTMREGWDEAILERWGGANYAQDASLTVPGRPLRLLKLPTGELLLVVMRGQRPYFVRISTDLQLLSTDSLGTLSRLSNLSARAETGTADNTLTPSFVIEGKQPKRIIIRAVGPTLKKFGLANPIPDPVITAFNDKQVAIAGNDNWGSLLNLADYTETANQLGAFALDAGSRDAALLLNLDPGAYTVQATDGTGKPGPAIVEVYDADDGGGASKLSNLAVRGRAGSGDSTLIGGFVISGDAQKTVLIRGVGPTLAKFGVSGTLADPVLKLFRQGTDTPLHTNDNWGDKPEIIAAAAKTGAFELTLGSKDASLLLTLDPGAYTVHLVSSDSSSGVAMIELYEVPE